MGTIHIGNLDISKVFLGSSQTVQSIWYGPIKVWGATEYWCTVPLCLINNGSSSTTITLSASGSPSWTGQYSTDNSTWTSYTLGTGITVPIFGKVYFRGTLSSASTGNYIYFASTSGSNISVAGNIMSLCSGSGFADVATIPSGAAFYRLFALGNMPTTLTDISHFRLPATGLTEGCYAQLLNGCSLVTTTPKLPAAALLNTVYSSAFRGTGVVVDEIRQSHDYAWTCPTTTGLTDPVRYMFLDTAGSFAGTPVDGTTYYWDSGENTRYTITPVAGSGITSVTGGGSNLELLTSTTLTATLQTGATFSGWFDTNNNLISTANPFTFDVPGNQTLTATAAKATVNLKSFYLTDSGVTAAAMTSLTIEE